MAQIPFRMRASIIAVGRRVRAFRAEQGMSLEELGRASRVGHKFIGAFELGKENCSLVTLLYLAEGLNCTLAQLICDEPGDGHVVLSADDAQRVCEAVTVLDTTFKPRLRSRRATR